MITMLMDANHHTIIVSWILTTYQYRPLNSINQTIGILNSSLIRGKKRHDNSLTLTLLKTVKSVYRYEIVITA